MAVMTMKVNTCGLVSGALRKCLTARQGAEIHRSTYEPHCSEHRGAGGNHETVGCVIEAEFEIVLCGFLWCRRKPRSGDQARDDTKEQDQEGARSHGPAKSRIVDHLANNQGKEHATQSRAGCRNSNGSSALGAKPRGDASQARVKKHCSPYARTEALCEKELIVLCCETRHEEAEYVELGIRLVCSGMAGFPTYKCTAPEQNAWASLVMERSNDETSSEQTECLGGDHPGDLIVRVARQLVELVVCLIYAWMGVKSSWSRIDKEATHPPTGASRK